MAEIVNLRIARKARARREAAATADANRVAFGRTKAEKLSDARTRARLDATLDGAKRNED